MLARFTPVLRTLTPVVAGVGAMPRRRFTLYNLAGGVAWAAATVLAGFFLGGVPLVATHVELVVTLDRRPVARADRDRGARRASAKAP